MESLLWQIAIHRSFPAGVWLLSNGVCSLIGRSVVSAQQNGIDTGIAPESVLPIEPDTLEGRMGSGPAHGEAGATRTRQTVSWGDALHGPHHTTTDWITESIRGLLPS